MIPPYNDKDSDEKDYATSEKQEEMNIKMRKK